VTLAIQQYPSQTSTVQPLGALLVAQAGRREPLEAPELDAKMLGPSIGQGFVPGAPEWSDWAADWFISDQTPRVVVSRQLAVLAINHSAWELISRGDLLSISDRHLSTRKNLLQPKLRQTVSSAREKESRLLLNDGDSEVMVIAAAHPDRPDEAVALTLRDTTLPATIECIDLRQLFGLTRSEQTAILGLFTGLSSTEIADGSGRSVLTVRTHVKRAYRKIGVRSLAQLFSRLLPYASICAAPPAVERTGSRPTP
jgi:DNA-binding CsgD family transcriptional regulator